MINYSCHLGTINIFLLRIKSAQTFLLMKHTTLQDLLKEPDSQKEQLNALDYAMSSVIAILRHEPNQLEEAVKNYESLYLLRKAIENYKAINPKS